MTSRDSMPETKPVLWTGSGQLCRAIMKSRELKAGVKALLMALANHCDGLGLAWPSQKTLEDELSKKVRTVRRQIEKLQASGYLTIYERSLNGHGDIYRVHFERFGIAVKPSARCNLEGGRNVVSSRMKAVIANLRSGTPLDEPAPAAQDAGSGQVNSMVPNKLSVPDANIPQSRPDNPQGVERTFSTVSPDISANPLYRTNNEQTLDPTSRENPWGIKPLRESQSKAWSSARLEFNREIGRTPSFYSAEKERHHECILEANIAGFRLAEDGLGEIWWINHQAAADLQAAVHHYAAILDRVLLRTYGAPVRLVVAHGNCRAHVQGATPAARFTQEASSAS